VIELAISFMLCSKRYAMAGKQAKILTDQQIETLLFFASFTRNPDRNRVIVLLSIKAGLRAGEIANVTWDMVVDPTGAVGSMLELRDHAAKNKSGRTIPLHPNLRAALIAWRDRTGAVVGLASERGPRMTAMSIVNWFAAAFRIAGLNGCSSHSGRRTFITRAARVVHQAGASLLDVQLLAGIDRYR
jgi:integrase